MGTQKRGNRIGILLLFALFALFLSPLSSLAARGCCLHPEVGENMLCSYTSQVEGTSCCPNPSPQTSAFYSSTPSSGLPANQQQCLDTFFIEDTDCEEVDECKQGCCCESTGGRETSQKDCTSSSQGSPFTVFPSDGADPQSCEEAGCDPPECNDGEDNDGNGCMDSEDTGCGTTYNPTDQSEANGVCLGQAEGCDDPNYVPRLTAANFEITPVFGKKQFQIQFKAGMNECPDTTAFYNITRCTGAGCTDFRQVAVVGSAVSSYVDTSPALQFEPTIYRYRVIVTYTIPRARPALTSPDVTLGDMECFAKTAPTQEFCIYQSTYSSLAQTLYPTPNGYDKDSKVNKGYRCSLQNQLEPQSNAICTSSQTCVVRENDALCAINDQCAPPSSGNLYGLFSNEQQCIAGNKYCFFDKTATIANACYSCQQGMSCYDYKSSDACQNDRCGLGTCQWRSSAASLGIGVCIDTSKNNCNWCDKKSSKGLDPAKPDDLFKTAAAHNDIFDACTEQRANLFDNLPQFNCEYLPSPSPHAKACQEITCDDLPHESPNSKCPTSQTELETGNVLKQRSGVPCAKNMCRNINNDCVKDANADGTDDCSGLQSTQKTACQNDLFAPNATITPSYDSTGLLQSFELTIADTGSWNLPPTPISASESGYLTYLCLDPCTQTKHPYTISTAERSLVYTGNKLFDSQGRLLLTFEQGVNSFKYYSIDPNKNIGPINTVQFTTQNVQSKPRLVRIFINNSKTQDGIIYAGNVSQINITFFLPTHLRSAQLTKTPGGDRFVFTPTQGTPKETHTALFPQSIPDGTYSLDITAQSTEDVLAIINRTIVVDSAPPQIKSFQPNAIAQVSPTPISIEFEREAALINVTINGISYRSLFTPVTTSSGTGAAATQAQSKTKYQGTLALDDGVWQIVITAESFSGIRKQFLQTLEVNTKPPIIRLTAPKYGGSSKVPFDINITPDNDAACKYEFGQATQYSFMKQFSSKTNLTHTISQYSPPNSQPVKLHVICHDPLLNLYGNATFNISVDTTKPVIRRSFAYPASVQDIPHNTILNVESDEPIICKYSNATEPFADMTPFASFENASFGVIAKQNITLPSEGAYSYKVICINRAELESDVLTIPITVNTSIPVSVGTSMLSVYKTSNVQFVVNTSKRAQCKYATTQQTEESGTVIGPPDIIHRTLLSNLKDGSYTYYVTCKDAYLNRLSNMLTITFKVDTQPPVMALVDDSTVRLENPQVSCLSDRLRVKLQGIDNGSGVHSYSYALLHLSNQTIVSNYRTTTKDNQFFFLENLSLTDNTQYFFRAKAKDFADFEGTHKDSDGVLVNTAFCVANPKCGDGKVNAPGEECDNATFGAIRSCSQYVGYSKGSLKCTSKCRLDTSNCSQSSVCGNGILEPGEACDGSLAPENLSCTMYTSSFSSGQVGCTSSCELDTSKCQQKSTCGNGVIEPGEMCDGNALALTDRSCRAYSDSFLIGELSCNSKCRLDTSACTASYSLAPTCGDGILSAGETCDGNAAVALSSCTDYTGTFSGGSASCDANCMINTSLCTPIARCGNGAITPGESCEPNFLGLQKTKCIDYSPNFASGDLSCKNDCKLSTSACKTTQGVCGNGILETGEICDGDLWAPNMTQKSCTSYSPYFYDGQLSCALCQASTNDCKINEISCADRGDCAINATCNDNSNCKTQFCLLGKCAEARCDDKVENQGETDIDCGGSCAKCADGKGCFSATDCVSGSCNYGICGKKNLCENGALDPGEGGIDCGGLCSKTCGEGDPCVSSSDCETGYECAGGVCAPSVGSDRFMEWAIQNGIDTTVAGWEDADPDSDDLTHRSEYGYLTMPFNQDTDGDGFSDGDEVAQGYDPLDPLSYPGSDSGGFSLIWVMIPFFALILLLGAGYYTYPPLREAIDGALKRPSQRQSLKQPSKPQSLSSLPSFSIPARQQQAPQKEQSAPSQSSLKKQEEKNPLVENLFKKRHEEEHKKRLQVFGLFGAQEVPQAPSASEEKIQPLEKKTPIKIVVRQQEQSAQEKQTPKTSLTEPAQQHAQNLSASDETNDPIEKLKGITQKRSSQKSAKDRKESVQKLKSISRNAKRK